MTGRRVSIFTKNSLYAAKGCVTKSFENHLKEKRTMIVQHKITLAVNEKKPVSPMAYPLYAWLLSHVPKEEGDALHEQGIRPISQYVYREGERVQWVVNLLNEEAATFFDPILERADAALLHQGVIPFGEHQVEKIDSVQTLMNRAGERNDENRFALELVTPTAFKQNGRYAVFPQESLVLQSLIARWGLCFPEFPLDDPDAVQAMLAGLHIVDYRLHTVRYSMKQTKIPSFLGRIILEAHLPAPLLEMFRTLYVFAPYAGIGIKSALGMGGVKIE